MNECKHEHFIEFKSGTFCFDPRYSVPAYVSICMDCRKTLREISLESQLSVMQQQNEELTWKLMVQTETALQERVKREQAELNLNFMTSQNQQSRDGHRTLALTLSNHFLGQSSFTWDEDMDRILAFKERAEQAEAQAAVHQKMVEDLINSRDIQRNNADGSYMCGILNGLELAVSIFTGEEPEFAENKAGAELLARVQRYETVLNQIAGHPKRKEYGCYYTELVTIAEEALKK